MLPPSLLKLIEELAKLPSVGQKSARRLAFYLVSQPNDQPLALARALEEAAHNLGQCECCFGLSQGPVCELCQDPRRNQEQMCVVEEGRNVFSIEASHVFQGLYHVLGGSISPLSGIYPEDLKIAELERRVLELGIKEIIIATNPDLEGEATAHYLTDLFKQSPVKVSRIARGMPSGGDLEFTDAATLARAFEGRQPFDP
ncbi:MAG: recombination protein RecR [Candidatus Lambdaproteobacteria bacterium RIFOXYD12_FULL_49_8]|uniref:Recombination protein RecR n=1 Tax=Candidatus Lambdaproteobacteria bacterium RIFOXYD2_FULL_50_16 TaxID=1817772 RepID=A0A1F6GBQ7_9PROT|nr:MAG: recombination protein RecR [Candidatus Lambdaproteobacteria bacterium RIFOXYD2_FULL_50_16]OGG97581.1 MAG: recombination protein RecR [Candidatus Lambdaproteobacteria bacterium RIFOXYD12_FULL_49_8]